MSAPTVDEFRAKVLVILNESIGHTLSIGHAARRITEAYAEAIAETPLFIDLAEQVCDSVHVTTRPCARCGQCGHHTHPIEPQPRRALIGNERQGLPT